MVLYQDSASMRFLQSNSRVASFFRSERHPLEALETRSSGEKTLGPVTRDTASNSRTANDQTIRACDWPGHESENNRGGNKRNDLHTRAAISGCQEHPIIEIGTGLPGLNHSNAASDRQVGGYQDYRQD